MADDFNPLGNLVAPNAIEAIVFQLRKMITNLTGHADHDGRAQDAVNYLNLTIDALVSDPYAVDTNRTAPPVSAEDAAAIVAADTNAIKDAGGPNVTAGDLPKSPGKDPVTGEDLAPFTPAQFPTDKGEFGRFGE